jgi:hypothetical protein
MFRPILSFAAGLLMGVAATLLFAGWLERARGMEEYRLGYLLLVPVDEPFPPALPDEARLFGGDRSLAALYHLVKAYQSGGGAKRDGSYGLAVWALQENEDCRRAKDFLEEFVRLGGNRKAVSGAIELAGQDGCPSQEVLEELGFAIQ